ncbi:uL15 family ribosomal protein [Candidatus Kaiserbacteria bacterium]|nr:uL15 family ribosomal protein [Candidatus Kaiserbacteria bacterium]
MQLNTLRPRNKNYKSTVIGRGGKRGKTSGRGGKGQTARAGHKIRPEMRDIIKKLPKRRGWGINRSRTVRINRLHYAPVNLAALEAAFPAGATITPAALIGKGLIRGRVKVKILGTGTLSKSFTITGCAFSAAARAAILKAGGLIQ